MAGERPTVDTPWDDPAWTERGDSAWARRLRLQQAWWRAERLGVQPGPLRPSDPGRLVCSMLPVGEAYARLNFLSDEAATAAEARLAERGSGGLVNPDRLRRNLLSSQPLCFNLFGHVASQPSTLVPWLRSLGLDAAEVTAVRLEWAPPREQHFDGGSAFDAFVEYRRPDDALGFVGVECKYAEDLRKTDVKQVRDEYRTFTAQSGHWRDGAAERLDSSGTRQLWLNTLLAQSLAATPRYAEGTCVVVACRADEAAYIFVNQVRGQLVDESWLRWSPYEVLLETLGPAMAEWKECFV
jgi:hypothetical protein